MYKDEELSQIFKKVRITVLITLVIIIPFIFYVYVKYDKGTSKLIRKIDNGEELLLFVTGNNCSECNNIENILKENNIDYIKINKDKDNDNYVIILNKIKLNEKFAPAPSLIYITDGKLNTNIYDFENADLDSFFKRNSLIGGNNNE